MTEPLTDAELDAIEQRANAATPGPWYAVLFADVYTLLLGERYDSASLDGPGINPEAPGVSTEQAGKNIAFAAHAREDVPRMVAEVRRLLARVKELEGR